jgi:2-iminobutanoate/2-iminopropanoate deaminase
VLGPYRSSVAAGGLIFLSGQVGKLPGSREVAASVDDQTRRCLVNLLDVLADHDLDASALVACRVYLTDMADFEVMNRSYAAAIAPHCPARTTVAVAALPLGARVEIEAVAAAP